MVVLQGGLERRLSTGTGPLSAFVSGLLKAIVPTIVGHETITLVGVLLATPDSPANERQCPDSNSAADANDNTNDSVTRL